MNGSQIVRRLQFSFAVLTCLGGLVLASGTQNELIPATAIFFSIFGFLFVDRMRLFSLPSFAAYVAMGLVTLYCVLSFLDLDQPGNHQMISVSQLLVCVQAILMLQRKTIRIYEQLAVFCLLELVVAAVFNDALNYGLLLIPICIVGIWALTLLGIATAIDSVDDNFHRLVAGFDANDANEIGTDTGQATIVQVHDPESSSSMSRVGMRLPRLVMLSFAPGVIIIAAFFFYALPRTTNAGRVRDQGMAVVGFNDEVRLEQLGQMGQNGRVAAKITLRRRSTDDPYQPIEGVFLRGAVLERYRAERVRASTSRAGRSSSVWSAISDDVSAKTHQLPPEFFPAEFYEDSEGDLSSDSIAVEVSYAASRSSSLFGIPPYFSIDSNPGVLHCNERWTLLRDEDRISYPRITYTFGTHAFRGGNQCEAIVTGLTLDLLAIKQRSEFDRANASSETLNRMIRTQQQIAHAQSRWEIYRKETLDFDREAMPTIQKIADSIAKSTNRETSSGKNKLQASKRPHSYALVKALEKHFLVKQRYQYSLNLDAESVVDMDPIEQFVSVDRVGHCQYFASALAMMLRSQGIPSRVIVGYKTDEYNEIGGHYIARQLHAHAWVEALIDREDLDRRRIAGVQPLSDQYWVRLDPTPSSFDANQNPSQASQVINLAQNIWEGLVVEMDSERQSRVISGQRGSSVLSQSYGTFVDRISTAVAKIRNGRLGGGSLANFDGFSWQASVIGVVACMALVFIGALIRQKPVGWIRNRFRQSGESPASRPSVDFYASAVDQLKRVGIKRSIAQTPQELLANSISTLAEPLKLLTSVFYNVRYGGNGLPTSQSRPSSSEVEKALEDLTSRVDAIRSGNDTAKLERPPEKS